VDDPGDVRTAAKRSGHILCSAAANNAAVVTSCANVTGLLHFR
jgi:hypothetical protein